MPDTNDMQVIWRVKELGEKRGYNPHTLTLAAGLAYNTVRPIWNNTASRASLESMAKLASALGVRPGDLLARADELATDELATDELATDEHGAINLAVYISDDERKELSAMYKEYSAKHSGISERDHLAAVASAALSHYIGQRADVVKPTDEKIQDDLATALDLLDGILASGSIRQRPHVLATVASIRQRWQI